jgi:rubrerythrin
MDAGEFKVIEDERNVERVLQNARREADACSGYSSGAEETGNERLADFFRDVRETHMEVARRAKEMLGDLSDEQRLSGARTGSTPSEGDPGDLSPGQDDVA